MQHGFEFKTLGFDFFIIAQIDSEKKYRIMSITLSACNLIYGVQTFSLDLPDLIQNQPAIYTEIWTKLKEEVAQIYSNKKAA